MKRRPMKKKESKKVFRKGAAGTHKLNVRPMVMRGGFRL